MDTSLIAIRPYTISQLAVLLLVAFVLLYVHWATHRHPAGEQTTTRWMMRAIAWGGVNVLFTALAGVTNYPPLDLFQYLRSLCAFFLFHALVRGFYALPPTHAFGHPQEARSVSSLLLLGAGSEAIYTGWRFYSFWQTGFVPTRPFWGNAPLLLAALAALLLLARKLWAAEADTQLARRQRWRRVILAPQSDIGSLYRWFLLVIISLAGVTLLISWFQIHPIPAWVMVAVDLLAMASLVTTAFVYLRYRSIAIGLEVRVVGGVLVIFLGLVSALGWLISLTFLGQEAPGLPVSDLVGSQLRLQFQPPPAYTGLLAQLSALLLPLIAFQMVGTLVIVLFFALYYRRTVTSALDQMAQGLAQLEQGHLAFRLTPPAWQDELSRIIGSFNHMAQTLESSAQEVGVYQTHLQELVELRTAELTREIEVRKELELHQAIQEERARIARETHDGLLQTLLGVRIRLNRGKRISQQEASRIEAELHELAVEVTQAAQDLRNLINDLNADILADGLLPALRRIIERQQTSYAIPIQAELSYAPGLLTPAQELNLLRIAQESLTNLCCHSHASRAWVLLRAGQEEDGTTGVLLEVRDDGDGFDPGCPAGSGWGIKNMQRRAEQLGADFHILSQPGEGTRVQLTMEGTKGGQE